MGRRRSVSAEAKDWLPDRWQPSNIPAELATRLRAGVSRLGHLGRVRRVLARVDRGEPIVMAALGSSVTSDFGGAVGYMQERFKLGYIGVPRKCRGKCVQYGWLLPIFRFLTQNQAAAHNMQNASLVNCGQAARFISTYLDCTSSAVPETADLIIIDGSNGMAPVVGSKFLPTEKLVRRLLSLPHQPAIIVLHWMDWCACSLSVCKPGPRVNRHKSLSCYQPQGFNESWIIGRRREDETGWADLAKHYRLPTLSLRRALHPSAMPQAVRSSSDVNLANVSQLWRFPQTFTWDGLHPMACSSSWENDERCITT